MTTSEETKQKRIVLSGASGLIGKGLAQTLVAEGYDVVRLIRREPRKPDEVRWNPDAGELDAKTIDGAHAVIHLGGENVAEGRWTDERKKQIVDSRLVTTRLIATTIAAVERKPAAFLCASAIGIYGDRGPEPIDETASSGSGFLAEVCRSWEAACDPARDVARTVHLRFGVVLSKEGGALAKLLPVFKLGVGGRIGDGRQFMSWLSADDAVRAAVYAMTSDLRGPINVVAPHAVSNAELTRTLAKVVHRPAIVPVPAFAIKALFGQMGEETVLSGSNVVPKKLLDAGYVFRHPTLEEALRFELDA